MIFPLITHACPRTHTHTHSLSLSLSLITEYELFRIELTKNYSFSDWRDDIKKMHRLSGFDGKPTVFLFSDNQIKDESFLEDVNMILNTGVLSHIMAS